MGKSIVFFFGYIDLFFSSNCLHITYQMPMGIVNRTIFEFSNTQRTDAFFPHTKKTFFPLYILKLLRRHARTRAVSFPAEI